MHTHSQNPPCASLNQAICAGVRLPEAHLSADQGAPQDPGHLPSGQAGAGAVLQSVVRRAHGADQGGERQQDGGAVGGVQTARPLLHLHLSDAAEDPRGRPDADGVERPPPQRGHPTDGDEDAGAGV